MATETAMSNNSRIGETIKSRATTITIAVLLFQLVGGMVLFAAVQYGFVLFVILGLCVSSAIIYFTIFEILENVAEMIDERIPSNDDTT